MAKGTDGKSWKVLLAMLLLVCSSSIVCLSPPLCRQWGGGWSASVHVLLRVLPCEGDSYSADPKQQSLGNSAPSQSLRQYVVLSLPRTAIFVQALGCRCLAGQRSRVCQSFEYPKVLLSWWSSLLFGGGEAGSTTGQDSRALPAVREARAGQGTARLNHIEVSIRPVERLTEAVRLDRFLCTSPRTGITPACCTAPQPPVQPASKPVSPTSSSPRRETLVSSSYVRPLWRRGRLWRPRRRAV